MEKLENTTPASAVSAFDPGETTIVLPFAVPPADILDAWQREAGLPVLRQLLTQAAAIRAEVGDSFSPTLPHERWLLAAHGRATGIAPLGLAAAGHAPGETIWWELLPVHIHAARDHLVLTDPAQLALNADESTALFAAAQPLLAELSPRLIAAAPDRWYLGGEQLDGLSTASPLRAIGRNIDAWMPSGAPARLWRRIQNEVQMTWHMHEVNAAREARGLPAVNSLWIHGGGRLLSPRGGTAPTIEVVDSLRETWIAADWSAWSERFEALDATRLREARDALAAGRIDAMRLLIGGEAGLIDLRIDRRDLGAWWRRWTRPRGLASSLRPAAAA